MAGDTKDRILDAALIMFSQNGYSGTNMRELAQSLGLTKAALYKHYQSKEEILNSLLTKIDCYYAEHFGSPDKLPSIPESREELIALTMNLVNFTVNDEKIVMVRKLMLTEQFRNERVKELASRHFLTETEKMFSRIFTEMIKNKILKNDDQDLMAFAYTAPISAMIHLCDRAPENKEEAVKKIRKFAEHFTETYKTDKEK